LGEKEMISRGREKKVGYLHFFSGVGCEIHILYCEYWGGGSGGVDMGDVFFC
jgi:hypothetical protein